MPKVDLNITHVTTRNWHCYQVRISIKHKEVSRAFGWTKYGGAEGALKAAQQWRDKQRKKLKLPPVALTKAGNSRPAYYKYKQIDSTSTNAVGVCRVEYFDSERTLTEGPRVVYAASYRYEGRPSNKSFSCGLSPTHDQERAGFEAAYAFRQYWEQCFKGKRKFNPKHKRWINWRKEFGFNHADTTI